MTTVIQRVVHLRFEPGKRRVFLVSPHLEIYILVIKLIEGTRIEIVLRRLVVNVKIPDIRIVLPAHSIALFILKLLIDLLEK